MIGSQSKTYSWATFVAVFNHQLTGEPDAYHLLHKLKQKVLITFKKWRKQVVVKKKNNKHNNNSTKICTNTSIVCLCMYVCSFLIYSSLSLFSLLRRVSVNYVNFKTIHLSFYSNLIYFNFVSLLPIIRIFFIIGITDFKIVYF